MGQMSLPVQFLIALRGKEGIALECISEIMPNSEFEDLREAVEWLKVNYYLSAELRYTRLGAELVDGHFSGLSDQESDKIIAQDFLKQAFKAKTLKFGDFSTELTFSDARKRSILSRLRQDGLLECTFQNVLFEGMYACTPQGKEWVEDMGCDA